MIAGTVALYDYVSGAKAAREALKGKEERAKSWKDTAAETFYGKNQGLSFFGMSAEDFAKSGREDIEFDTLYYNGGSMTEGFLCRTRRCCSRDISRCMQTEWCR